MIKEQNYKCYLQKYINSFDSLSVNHLATEFELDASYIKKITYKMIYNRELTASIRDEDGGFIMFTKVEVSHIQKHCDNILEKIVSALEQNERILDGKEGNYGFAKEETRDDAFAMKRKINNRKKNLVNIAQPLYKRKPKRKIN